MDWFLCVQQAPKQYTCARMESRDAALEAKKAHPRAAAIPVARETSKYLRADTEVKIVARDFKH